MSSGRDTGLPVMDVYSVMCVRDRARSVAWYEVFFGRPADEVIGEEYLWQAGENGNGVRHVEILDPDGNSLSLAQG